MIRIKALGSLVIHLAILGFVVMLLAVAQCVVWITREPWLEEEEEGWR